MRFHTEHLISNRAPHGLKPEENAVLSDRGRTTRRTSAETLHAERELSRWLNACPVDLPEALRGEILATICKAQDSHKIPDDD